MYRRDAVEHEVPFECLLAVLQFACHGKLSISLFHVLAWCQRSENTNVSGKRNQEKFFGFVWIGLRLNSNFWVNFFIFKFSWHWNEMKCSSQKSRWLIKPIHPFLPHHRHQTHTFFSSMNRLMLFCFFSRKRRSFSPFVFNALSFVTFECIRHRVSKWKIKKWKLHQILPPSQFQRKFWPVANSMPSFHVRV